MNPKKNLFANLKSDLPSGLVVFLVALPLCLGIALASGAPFFSGIISGIVGGIVIGALSNSPLSVSGPAAGLAALVMGALVSPANSARARQTRWHRQLYSQQRDQGHAYEHRYIDHRQTNTPRVRV